LVGSLKLVFFVKYTYSVKEMLDSIFGCEIMQIIYQYKNFSPFIYQFFLITWNSFNRKFILNEMDELKITFSTVLSLLGMN